MNLKTQAEKNAYALGYRTGINRALAELDKETEGNPYDPTYSDDIRAVCEKDADIVDFAARRNMGMDV